MRIHIPAICLFSGSLLLSSMNAWSAKTQVSEQGADGGTADSTLSADNSSPPPPPVPNEGSLQLKCTRTDGSRVDYTISSALPGAQCEKTSAGSGACSITDGTGKITILASAACTFKSKGDGGFCRELNSNVATCKEQGGGRVIK